MEHRESPPAGVGTDALAEIEQQLRQGSFFVQASLEQQGRLVSRLDTFVTSLLDLLIDGGVVDLEALTEVVEANRRQQAEDRAAALQADSGLAAWPTVLVREERDDDPQEPETPVDCAARLPICKAACCTLRFPLSPSEITGGVVRFDLGHPYLIRHTAEGRCTHNDPTTGGCTVYENRPQVCRAYSCATDERIWTDFENMVLNEEYLASRSPQQFHFTPTSSGAVPVTIRPRGGAGTPAAPAPTAERVP
jgi:Fe-S-cluster containining protein